MHWCVYPSPTHSLIQAKKQLNKSANTENQQNTISKHNTIMKAVGVTGKTAKWLQKKRAPNVFTSFLLQNASVSQTQKHR